MALRRSGVRSPSAPPTSANGRLSGPARDARRSCGSRLSGVRAGVRRVVLRMQFSKPIQSTRWRARAALRLQRWDPPRRRLGFADIGQSAFHGPALLIDAAHLPLAIEPDVERNRIMERSRGGPSRRRRQTHSRNRQPASPLHWPIPSPLWLNIPRKAVIGKNLSWREKFGLPDAARQRSGGAFRRRRSRNNRACRIRAGSKRC